MNGMQRTQATIYLHPLPTEDAACTNKASTQTQKQVQGQGGLFRLSCLGTSWLLASNNT